MNTFTYDVTYHNQSMQDTLHTMSHQSYMLANHTKAYDVTSQVTSQICTHYIHCMKTKAKNMLV